MAKFAKRKKTGAAPKINIQSKALKIGGAILASKLQGMLSKDPTKTMLVNIAPFVGIVGGVVLPMVSKNAVVKDLADGMLIAGGLSALKKFVPALVGNFPMVPVVNGPQRQILNRAYRPSFNGVGFPLPETSVYDDPMSVISGIAGYDVNGSGAAVAN